MDKLVMKRLEPYREAIGEVYWDDLWDFDTPQQAITDSCSRGLRVVASAIDLEAWKAYNDVMTESSATLLSAYYDYQDSPPTEEAHQRYLEARRIHHAEIGSARRALLESLLGALGIREEPT